MRSFSYTLLLTTGWGIYVLHQSDNEILTHIGPHTPMGNLIRQYWVPALLSSEIVCNGRPVRVKLLGENLIAFRNSTGQVGILQEACAHRKASLFFGRNEDCGLRCAYHGWKYDIEGNCIDMPNEPPSSNFKNKVRLTAYPCVERNGVIWTYMGKSKPPDLPHLEWNTVSEDQVYLSKRVQDCNFVQIMEGEIDASHVAFLHGPLNPFDMVEEGNITAKGNWYKANDLHPLYETLDTEYGVVLGARREAEEDSYYWRITQFLMPFHFIIPPYGPDPTFTGHAFIPMDDFRTMCLTFTYHPTRALTEDELNECKYGRNGYQGLHLAIDHRLPPNSEAGGAWLPSFNRENDYGLSEELQRTKLFSGIPAIWAGDAAVQESMGHIVDRSDEHLGAGDAGLISVRRRLLRAAKAFDQKGIEPPGISDPKAYAVRSTAVVLPKNMDFVEGAHEKLVATPGVNYAAV